jgi:hypothetical protein
MGNNLSGCLRAHQQIDLAAGETPLPQAQPPSMNPDMGFRKLGQG